MLEKEGSVYTVQCHPHIASWVENSDQVFKCEQVVLRNPLTSAASTGSTSLDNELSVIMSLVLWIHTVHNQHKMN